MSKILLILPFVFVFIGIFTVIYIMYTTIFEKRKKKMKDREIEKLRESLSSYEFESTQQNAVNKSFSFMEYLYSGDYIKVIKDFKDYYGFTYQAGEKFYFACVYFLPYEDGYTLYISKDKINIPVDVVILPHSANDGDFPILIEAKSAGDFTNVNKRRKEEAVKMQQLKNTYGIMVSYNLFLCGYFDSGYLGYEAAEGIDWIWEHRISDIKQLGI